MSPSVKPKDLEDLNGDFSVTRERKGGIAGMVVLHIGNTDLVLTSADKEKKALDKKTEFEQAIYTLKHESADAFMTMRRDFYEKNWTGIVAALRDQGYKEPDKESFIQLAVAAEFEYASAQTADESKVGSLIPKRGVKYGERLATTPVSVILSEDEVRKLYKLLSSDRESMAKTEAVNMLTKKIGPGYLFGSVTYADGSKDFSSAVDDLLDQVRGLTKNSTLTFVLNVKKKVENALDEAVVTAAQAEGVSFTLTTTDMVIVLGDLQKGDRAGAVDYLEYLFGEQALGLCREDIRKAAERSVSMIQANNLVHMGADVALQWLLDYVPFKNVIGTAANAVVVERFKQKTFTYQTPEQIMYFQRLYNMFFAKDSSEVISVDGKMGKQTEAAIKRMQLFLKEQGMYDPKYKGKIDEGMYDPKYKGKIDDGKMGKETIKAMTNYFGTLKNYNTMLETYGTTITAEIGKGKEGGEAQGLLGQVKEALAAKNLKKAAQFMESLTVAVGALENAEPPAAGPKTD